MRAGIESVAESPERCETIVVIDHSPALLERALAELSDERGRVRVLGNDGRQGLSGARNTGVLAAEGDYLAFLDDDATARPGWLGALLAPVLDDPAVQVVGGTAKPVWPSTVLPERLLLPEELFWVIGCSHRGLPEQRAEVRNVIGCSMLFRRSAVIAVGGFDLDTGRVGSTPLGCEETELCIRLTTASPGSKTVLEPSATVDHMVTAGRVTWRYLRQRSYREGVSKAIVARRHGANLALSTERSYLRTAIPSAMWRELRAIGRGGARRSAAIVIAVMFWGLGYVRAGFAGRGGPIVADPRFTGAL